MIKKTLLILAFLAALAVPALAQEAEISGGGGGGVSTAPGSGTAGRVPQFVSATSLADSKMTTSGTNSGTWTLYDDTAVTGVTSLVLRNGAGQGSVGALEANGDGVEFIGRSASNRFSAYLYALSIGNTSVGAGEARIGTGTGTVAIYSNTIAASSGVHLRWSSGDATAVVTDSGILRDGLGILRVTDGSTGQGGIGISDSAETAVSDALILRHNLSSDTATVGMGTGLLFQGEDAAGNMQDMASIDAVYTDATNGSEDTRFVLRTTVAGVDTEALAFSVDRVVGSSLTLDAADGSANLNFATSGVTRWYVRGAGIGNLYPNADKSYDFGHPSLQIKDSYLSTSIQGTRTKTLTDNTITDVVQISSATTDRVTAGHVSYTVYASDATNHLVQTETGEVPFLLVNENGTVTVTLGTVYGTAIDSAGGAALTNTFASSVSGTDAKIRVTSNYDQATLTGTVTHTIEYRVYIDSGTATVTPQ